MGSHAQIFGVDEQVPGRGQSDRGMFGPTVSPQLAQRPIGRRPWSEMPKLSGFRAGRLPVIGPGPRPAHGRPPHGRGRNAVRRGAAPGDPRTRHPAPRPTSRSEWCGNEEPRPGHWVRAPAERGSEIPRGTLAYGVGGAPEGAFNATLFIDALQANGPFNAGWPSRPVARGPRTGGGRFWGTRSASGSGFVTS